MVFLPTSLKLSLIQNPSPATGVDSKNLRVAAKSEQATLLRPDPTNTRTYRIVDQLNIGRMGKRRALSDSLDFEQGFSDADWTESTKKGSRQGVTRQGKRLKKEEDTLRGSKGIQHSVSHACNLHVVASPQECRIALLRWYSGVETARGMPWRKPYDPSLGFNEKAQRAYEVWVSEVMLQQTQVATVIPYYNRWMEKFPTLAALAASSIEDVNALWKGLGYYSRASRLLEGAEKAVRDYGGNLPDNAKEMEANIPGIGRYSAGAICSIAYGERVPVLDGNVHRVLSRLLALHAPPKAKATLDILWQAATDMVKKQLEPPDAKIPSQNRSENALNKGNHQHPGDINQALIELGSTICKVRDPQCESCPLQPWCAGYSRSSGKNPTQQQDADIEEICSVCVDVPSDGDVTIYPMKAARKKAREELDVVNVTEWRSVANPQDRWFLVVRRPDDGLLAGLYEFPTVENISQSVTTSILEKAPSELLAKLLQPGTSSRTRPSKVADHPSDSSSLNDVVTGCTLRKVEPMGDIIHTFSHIKKTYRVQWVIVEGGDELPELRAGEKQIIKSKKLTSRTKKAKSKSTEKVAATEMTPSSQWVRLEDVAKLNIGTGVAKVWDLARKHWMQDVRNQGEA